MQMKRLRGNIWVDRMHRAASRTSHSTGVLDLGIVARYNSITCGADSNKGIDRCLGAARSDMVTTMQVVCFCQKRGKAANVEVTKP